MHGHTAPLPAPGREAAEALPQEPDPEVLAALGERAGAEGALPCLPGIKRPGLKAELGEQPGALVGTIERAKGGLWVAARRPQPVGPPPQPKGRLWLVTHSHQG